MMLKLFGSNTPQAQYVNNFLFLGKKNDMSQNFCELKKCTCIFETEVSDCVNDKHTQLLYICERNIIFFPFSNFPSYFGSLSS